MIHEIRADEEITEADTLIPTLQSQLGVAYDAHLIEGILEPVAPAPGWRRPAVPRRATSRRATPSR